MKTISLKELVAERGVTAVAEELGCSPPAITKALKANREVYVEFLVDGSLKAVEIKEFPSIHHSKKSAA